jgi:hypothetical protein
MRIFQTQGILWFWDFLLGYPKTVFEFIGQFFFKNDIFKLQKVFQSMESEYFLGSDFEASRNFLFYIFETNQMC